MTETIADIVMRQAGIVKDVQFVAQATATSVIDLRSGPVYAIKAAYKNGTAMTIVTDYAWSLYRSNVALVAPSALNDHFTFTIQTKASAVVDDLVTRHGKEVLRALRPFYDFDAIADSPDAEAMVVALCVGQLKQDMAQGTALDSAFYRSGRDLQIEVRDQIRRIQRGTEGLYGTTGAELSRIDGSIVGGRLHPDGDFVNRLGLQDRAQQHTGLFLTLTPDPILNDTRASRGFTA